MGVKMAEARNPFGGVLPFPGRGVIEGSAAGGPGIPTAPRPSTGLFREIRAERPGGGLQVRQVADAPNSFRVIKDGKVKASVEVQRVGDELYIQAIAGRGKAAPGKRPGEGVLGTKDTREALTQLRRFFPGVTRVSGERISGARDRAGTLERDPFAADVSVPLRPDVVRPRPVPPGARGGEVVPPEALGGRRAARMERERAQQIRAEEARIDEGFRQFQREMAPIRQAAQQKIRERTGVREVTPEVRRELLAERRLGSPLSAPEVMPHGSIVQHARGLTISENPITGRTRVRAGPQAQEFTSRTDALEWIASKPPTKGRGQEALE